MNLGLACGLAATVLAARVQAGSRGFVAHEWGTFTSVQGGDGNLVEWRPLETSRLPGFVYDWSRAGLGRMRASQFVYGKGDITCLQRMETPVIYFYADQEQRVDVSVRFPKGVITEWYPQAALIGPAMVQPSAAVAKLNALAYEAGAKPTFNLASFWNGTATMESRATWSGVDVLPAKAAVTRTPSLLTDASGSHYFAARETDANLIQLPSLCATNSMPELEKFIFYRGVGNFATPLVVKTVAGEQVTVVNTGIESLRDLYVLRVEKGQAKFVAVARLDPGARQTVEMSSQTGYLPITEASSQLGKQLAESLRSQGLYAREAAAMVKTWKDSWFEEAGLRVLYVLPRAWTDRTLPLELNPAPRELVRVMVGRAEVLSPEFENRLGQNLAKAQFGDSAAKSEVEAEFRSLGRFAEPAMTLALVGKDSANYQAAWELLQSARRK